MHAISLAGESSASLVAGLAIDDCPVLHSPSAETNPEQYLRYEIRLQGFGFGLSFIFTAYKLLPELFGCGFDLTTSR